MQEISVVFPNQLFQKHPALAKGREVWLVEEHLFFNQYAFHKKKLVFHRASMQYYADFLRKKGYTVHITEAGEEADIRLLVKKWNGKVSAIHIADVVDDWLDRRLTKAGEMNNIRLIRYASPGFLNEDPWQDGLLKNNRYYQADFYIGQRTGRQILLDGEGKPEGGKWSFDTENRKRLPKTQAVPVLAMPYNNHYLPEAIKYIKKHFNDNYGVVDGLFGYADGFYPVTHAEAEAWLDNFLEYRFALFGDYEDAIDRRHAVWFHSVLSPLLNAGLLTPQQVIDRALEAGTEKRIPINALEGFVRQIIGWREFIRLVYIREGRKQRTRHFWNFHRPVPESFWNGTTGIAPLDQVIRSVSNNAYAHHIERLMVMGNFMLLCEFNPDDVYRWFMELFIDAYDWVMVPNVYGMSQFADGGLMTTKPYISGSNYLMKMGNWTKGHWQEKWDGLFWRFLSTHRDFFQRQPRLGMLLTSWDKMDKEKQKMHLKNSDEFLKSVS
ncbi:MAG: deoxyribodipyrimidine photolyase [Sphingobacteriales bacterium SCN 48-20]|uniref:cryptochrome/photolyase family protein n=1 Tax=Terrimonas ferruginea TaxID=249 RepID=UPI00086D9305|nr:cryptochrome/photolyase family protein [Terrimonas ferruginea]ODT95945.1 MAG: deoxyribodipyrimidine photolyase [Sphingobacteriales bacterium SCN 48-20]OJW44384.1 MAG: cryptochrome/photolyase family protein [Sphingobacteriales bacterium 48-107]